MLERREDHYTSLQSVGRKSENRSSENVSVTLVLGLGDVTFCKHVITYMAEDLKLLNLGQCSTFAARLNGLDDSCFEHDDEERVRGGLAAGDTIT